jgi:hypothetical protein
MDPITRWIFSQREVDHISKSVWEIVKCIGFLLEAEDDDSDNDLFYTPLISSPLELIYAKLENRLNVNHG